MARFRIDDVQNIDIAPTSPASLRSKVGEMILSSTVCRARVETADPETGEYRLVLQGTLDKEETRWE